MGIQYVNAQKNTIPQTIIQQVDSINAFAFEAKRTDIVLALNSLINAQKIATQYNYKKGLAEAYLYEAGIYFQSGYNNLALSIYYKALTVAKENNDVFNSARANLQIASSLIAQKKYAKAEKTYNEALQVFKDLNNKAEIINVYNQLGQLYVAQKKYDKAKEYFSNALTQSTATNYLYGKKKALQNFGFLALYKAQFQEAKDMFFAVKAIDKQQHDYYGMALSNIHLASVEEETKNIDGYMHYAFEAYENAKQTGASSLMIASLRYIIDGYKAKHNFVKALEWQDTLVSVLNNRAKQDKQYALNFLDIIKTRENAVFTAEKIAAVTQKNAYWQKILLIVVSTALIVITLLAFYTFKHKNKFKKISKELEQKNAEIEKNIQSLDILNKEISEKNNTLQTQNKMKDKLLSIISHDLRHPLTNTKGILNLINQKIVTEQEAADLFEKLDLQYTQTLSLLDNLLYWIRSQMQGELVTMQKVNVNKLLEELIINENLTVNQKNILVSLNLVDDVVVNADEEIIKIVCRNILHNAIKFTNIGGTITIQTLKENLYGIIKIIDSGMGMSEQVLEKINNKEYYSTSGTLQEKGTGVGLMLCFDLIAKNKGDIMIESLQDKGTTVTIKLPLA